MKQICIVTGTRAEYGLLKPFINKVYCSEDIELQLVVTGMHLSTEFGLTYQEIEQDGYPITAKIEMLLGSDTQAGIMKSMGVELIGFADFFVVHKPDIVVLLGDRYETLIAAIATMTARIPIAHIHGGELTEGAIDEAIRHSITKMSQLHFTSTDIYRKRVIQLGEQPNSVFNVGALGVENVKMLKLLTKSELEETLHFDFDRPVLITTYHPVTLEACTAKKQFADILCVLDHHPDIAVIFTKANADPGGRVINKMIDNYVVENKDRCASFTSLGQIRYLSSLKYCVGVLGNSSSGIIEAPSFGIPTINIGERQKGRVCSESVITCSNDAKEIDTALCKGLSSEFRKKTQEISNPYEGINTSDQILMTIKNALQTGINLKKNFYDLRNM